MKIKAAYIENASIKKDKETGFLEGKIVITYAVTSQNQGQLIKMMQETEVELELTPAQQEMYAGGGEPDGKEAA